MNRYLFPKHAFVRDFLLFSCIFLIFFYVMDVSTTIILLTSFMIILILDFINELIFHNITLPLQLLINQAVLFNCCIRLTSELSNQPHKTHNDNE